MCLVKCISYYFDKELNKVINVGDEYEVTKERANVLVNNKVAEVLKEVEEPKEVTATPTEVDTKPKSRKRQEKK